MEYRAKVVILGACGCGKSSVVKKFLTGGFDPSQPSTIGAAFTTKEVMRGDLVINMDVWDTAGQERYGAIAPMYYRDAHTVVVVYDITDTKSIEAAEKWCREVRAKNKNALLVLFGNKTDLLAPAARSEDFFSGSFSEFPRKEKFSVFFETSFLKFKEYDVLHLCGSAKNGEGVLHLFKTIAGRTEYSRRVSVRSSSWWCF